MLFSDSFPKSKKKISTKATRQRPQNDDEECRDEQFTAKTDEKKEEVVKNKTDALWADFMKDVGAVKTQTKLSSDPMISKAGCISFLTLELHLRLKCCFTKLVYLSWNWNLFVKHKSIETFKFS